MKCIHCGAENADDSRICIQCGELLEQPDEPAEQQMITEPEQPAVLPDESVDGTGPMAEPEQPTEPQPTEKKKSIFPALAALLAVAAVAVVALVLIWRTIPSGKEPTADQPAADVSQPAGNSAADQAQEPSAGADITPRYPVTSYASPALVPEGAMDAVVGSYGSTALDNREINYYYWGAYYYLLNAYGTNLYQWMNPTLPLDQQLVNASDSSYTWQDYLLDSAQSTLRETYALVGEAERTGYAMSEDETGYLEQTWQGMKDAAQSSGYDDFTAYLRASYGPAAEEARFRTYYEHSMLAASYAQRLYSGFQFSQEEIAAYYDEGGYAENGLAQDDTCPVDVRHVLIMPQDDNWDAALAQAEALLAQWDEDPTEENFAELAAQYSQDPGSQNNGGLYSGVQPGQMVTEFNDWCFDSQRQPGDTGIVKTSYGYHIMYFSARGDTPVWMQTVEDDMRREAYQNAIAALVDASGYQLDYAAVVLASPDGLTQATE